MNRIVGIETEYGCLVTEEGNRASVEQWPARVRHHLFQERKLGVLDRHYRDYEEPPGNGGFLVNGGRIYVDMGHLEYASPECRTLRDLTRVDLAGDRLILRSLQAINPEGTVSFLKNNIDHYTGATFGCHENYLVRRDAPLNERTLKVLLAFLATRQIYAGAGRIGQANAFQMEMGEAEESEEPVRYQLSQRADHIVNSIYQWVQFNRAIINARDEPLADHRRFRRLHLLLGDSNMSPCATALKVGATDLMLTLIEREQLPPFAGLENPVEATRRISRDPDRRWEVQLDNGRRSDALTLQFDYLEAAEKALRGLDADADWTLQMWRYALEQLAERRYEALHGVVDWATKEWMLDLFAREQGVEWEDPWLQSLDLAYHDLDPDRGLFFGVEGIKAARDWNAAILAEAESEQPPSDTRANARAELVRSVLAEQSEHYVVNWESVEWEDRYYDLPDPYDRRVPAPEPLFGRRPPY